MDKKHIQQKKTPKRYIYGAKTNQKRGFINDGNKCKGNKKNILIRGYILKRYVYLQKRYNFLADAHKEMILIKKYIQSGYIHGKRGKIQRMYIYNVKIKKNRRYMGNGKNR